MGADFSRVRIHAGAAAAASAHSLGASAYTVGRDVVFGAGQYAPASEDGRALLAHELAHVAQQSAAGSANGARSSDVSLVSGDDRTEQQAAVAASGARLRLGGTSGTRIDQATGPVPHPAIIQLQRGGARKPAPAARRPRATRVPVVDDNQRAGAGQMHKTQFLDRLHKALIDGCTAELAPMGLTARDCPYIDRTIARYRTRPAAAAARAVMLWGQPPAGADAQGMIDVTVRRARVAARRIGQRYRAGGRRTSLSRRAVPAPSGSRRRPSRQAER